MKSINTIESIDQTPGVARPSRTMLNTSVVDPSNGRGPTPLSRSLPKGNDRQNQSAVDIAGGTATQQPNMQDDGDEEADFRLPTGFAACSCWPSQRIRNRYYGVQSQRTRVGNPEISTRTMITCVAVVSSRSARDRDTAFVEIDAVDFREPTLQIVFGESSIRSGREVRCDR